MITPSILRFRSQPFLCTHSTITPMYRCTIGHAPYNYSTIIDHVPYTDCRCLRRGSPRPCGSSLGWRDFSSADMSLRESWLGKLPTTSRAERGAEIIDFYFTLHCYSFRCNLRVFRKPHASDFPWLYFVVSPVVSLAQIFTWLTKTLSSNNMAFNMFVDYLHHWDAPGVMWSLYTLFTAVNCLMSASSGRCFPGKGCSRSLRKRSILENQRFQSSG